MTDTTPHDTWIPEVGDDVEDRRTGSAAAVTAVSDRPTVFLRFKGSGLTTVVPLPALRRTYRPATPTLEATVADTTQPDPQIVAWMRAYLCDHPAPGGYGTSNKATTMRACRNALGTTIRLRELSEAYDEAARKPATVADIPAGQGPASLAVVGDAVCYREADGHLRTMLSKPVPQAVAQSTLWDHLAATLPHVTTEGE